MGYPFNNNSATLDSIEKALSYISANERDICVKVGQALHNELGEPGYQLWIGWLQQSDKYNAKDMLAVWRSFNAGGGITIASIFFMAKESGFVFAKDSYALSPEGINKPKIQQQAKQTDINKAQIRKRHYAKQRINKLLPDIVPNGDPAFRYFYNRGLGGIKTPDSVRFHPAMEYWENGKLIGKYPALVSFVTTIDNTLETFHIIYLTNDGQKAPVPSPKKIFSPITTITGASIKFQWPSDELYLAEGLETALAVWLATGKPTWCCLSTHGLKTVIIPGTVKTVYIMADKDRSGAGEWAANQLAQRLLYDGVAVHIVLPEQEIPAGKKSIDWLDIYNMEVSAA